MMLTVYDGYEGFRGEESGAVPPRDSVTGMDVCTSSIARYTRIFILLLLVL